MAGIFAIRLKGEASFFTKADCTMPSRLAAVAQATRGMTVLACGGYMLQYSSVELRRSSTLGPPIRERITMLVNKRPALSAKRLAFSTALRIFKMQSTNCSVPALTVPS